MLQDFAAALIEDRQRTISTTGGLVNAELQMRTASSVYGHVIDLGVGHSIAIYERNGASWVAEFRDGHGEIMYAGAWFRLNSGGLRYCHNHRPALQRSMPLTLEVLETIERLHAEREARQRRMLAVPRTVATTARHYFVSAMSRLRSGTSKISQTLG